MPPTSSHAHVPLPSATGSLIYTETDEAPALATYSLLPILSKVCILCIIENIHIPSLSWK
jgi:monomeric isocitrate dehydrogenase